MTQPTIRLRGLAELISVLPHELGYRPARSLVVTALHHAPEEGRGRRLVAFTLRVDLPEPEHVDQLLTAVVEPVLVHGADAVLLVCFEDEPDDGTELLTELTRRLVAEGVEVDAAARVRGEQWAALDDEPPAWRAVPPPAEVPATADLVWRGATVAGQRSDLDRLLAGDARCHERLRLLLEEEVAGGFDPGSRADRLRAARIWGRLLRRSGMAQTSTAELVTEREVAVLALSLCDIPLRDGLLARLMPPGFDGPDFDPAVRKLWRRWLPRNLTADRAMVHRWCEIAGMVPPELQAPTATLVAVLAWGSGEGTLANVAVDRALQVDPRYTLAQLVQQMVTRTLMPPWLSGRGRPPGAA